MSGHCRVAGTAIDRRTGTLARLAIRRSRDGQECPSYRALLPLGLSLLLLALTAGCTPQADVQDVDAQTSGDQPGKKSGNRLAKETSPYLQRHARNPVDWQPWGPEALDRAKAEGKLIFLSIGYSSCHWCHVMEHKAFSHPEIARYMNDHFVCIKIDREERPDLDDVYMTALTIYYQQLKMPQAGGWPLTMFLTPDAKPLGGGSYFPPFDEDGQLGLMTVMKGVVDKWKSDRPQMEKNAQFLVKAVQSAARLRPSTKPLPLDENLLAPIVERLASGFDPQHGGFGYDPDDADRPKFPVPTRLALLQYEALRHGDKTAGQMLALSLDRMAEGGIYDHIGGGFHRYSTDRRWRVPHFEKMLYDNAQLAEIYAEAFQQTRDIRLREVAEGIVAFVLRDLTDPEGAFYTAVDADTDGVEGKHYLWTRRDLLSALTAEEAQLVESVYGLEGEQPFEQGYVLHVARPLADVAREWRLAPAQLQGHLTRIKGKLLAVRQKRPSPQRDEKILTGWNGLMIRSLARTGALLKRNDYIQAAARAAEFVLKNLRDDQGRLLRAYCQKQARIPAYLDDYAFLVDGLLALNEATGEAKWANAAVRLTDQQLALFWDEEGGGCFSTAKDHEQVLARMKGANDSVLPSGNSVTVRNLVRLATLTKKPEYRDRARETLELFAPLIDTNPATLTNMVLALREYLDAGVDVPGPQGPSRPRPASNPGPIQLVADETEEPPAKNAADKPPEHVKADVYFSTDRLPAGGAGRVAILLRITEGWHIQANPAATTDQEPTEVTLASKAGVKAGKIKYPPHKKYGTEEVQHVWENQALIEIPLEVPEKSGGRDDELTIEVQYQPCFKEIKCLQPATLTLRVPVKIARKGEPVKTINSRIFGKPAQSARK